MDTFCVLPFFSFELPQNSDKNIFCCQLPTWANINEIRNDIVAGQRNSACSSCWKMEDQNLPSERQLHNRTFDYYRDRDIELIQQDAVSGNFNAQIVKLATSNICNSACVTCGSFSSSLWASVEKSKQKSWRINQNTINAIEWKNVAQLSFVGGEPLLEKANLDILQHLIDIGNTKCFVSIVTNGSIGVSSTQLKILSKFSNLNICVSIDGIESGFEYARWPLQWEKILVNLDHLNQTAKYVSISCMVSNFTISRLDDLIDFFKSHNLPYLCKAIEDPSYFAPGNLPDKVKQSIKQSQLKYPNEVLPFLSYGKYTAAAFNDCWREIYRQDQLKKISIDNYLPEFAATKIYCTDLPIQ